MYYEAYDDCICTECIQIFFLSFFPKQHSIKTIYKAFTLYWGIKVIWRWLKVYRRMCVGYLQILHTLFYIRDLSICGFWCPRGVLEPIPHSDQETPYKDSKKSGNLDLQPFFWYLEWCLFLYSACYVGPKPWNNWLICSHQSSKYYSLQTVLCKQNKTLKKNSNCMYNQIHSDLKGITSCFNLLTIYQYLFIILVVFTHWWCRYRKTSFIIYCGLSATQKIP